MQEPQLLKDILFELRLPIREPDQIDRHYLDCCISEEQKSALAVACKTGFDQFVRANGHLKLMLTARTDRNYENTPLQLALEQLSAKKYEIVESTEYIPVLTPSCVAALGLDFDAIRRETGLPFSKECLEVQLAGLRRLN